MRLRRKDRSPCRLLWYSTVPLAQSTSQRRANSIQPSEPHELFVVPVIDSPVSQNEATMIELIKAIVEPVAKALSATDLLDGRDRKQLREIGTELFVFYNSVNELVVVCHRILGEIERGCSWMRRKLDEGKPDQRLLTHIPFWLGILRVSLIKTVQSIHRLGLGLRIIDRGCYLALIPLIHGKFRAISYLETSAGDEDCALVTYDEHLLQSAIDRFVGAAGAWPDDNLEPRLMLRQFMPQNIQNQTIEEAVRTVVNQPLKRAVDAWKYLAAGGIHKELDQPAVRNANALLFFRRRRVVGTRRKISVLGAFDQGRQIRKFCDIGEIFGSRGVGRAAATPAGALSCRRGLCWGLSKNAPH
jgi:hypothetical protein